MGKQIPKKQSEVLLVQPPVLSMNPLSPVEKEYWEAQRQVGQLLGDQPNEPNCGLLYVAAALREAGVPVELLDLNMLDQKLRGQKGRALTIGDVREILAFRQPRIIGISCMTIQQSWVMDIASLVKQLLPDCEVVIGGIHPTFQAQELLLKCPDIDVVVRGEGEVSMVELALEKPKDAIEGIVYCPNGRPEETAKRPFLTAAELDALPYPAYDLLPPEAFPLVPRVYTCRGCWGRCEFCVVNKFFENKPRYRNPVKVVDEIDWLQGAYGVEFVVMGDLTFGGARAMQVCDELLARKIKVAWWAQTRADAIVDGLVDLGKMWEAGCVQVAIGIEHGAQGQLDQSGKGIQVNDTIEACDLAKQAGLSVQGYFMIGGPGETQESALSTINLMDWMLQKRLVDITHISIAVPYPGTDFYANPENYGYTLISRDFSEYFMNCDAFGTGLPVYETEKLSRYELYVLWEHALATAARNYRARSKPKVWQEFGDNFMFVNAPATGTAIAALT